MSLRSFARGLAPVHLLLLVALLEVAINRVAVPMLRPAKGLPPAWHTVLDYGGLFLFYFAGTLAVGILSVHVARSVRIARTVRERVAAITLGVATVFATIPIFIAAPAVLSFGLEVTFAIAVIALVISVFGRDRDVGVQIGVCTLALPLLIHTVSVIGAKYLWPEAAFDGPGITITRIGVLMLCGAALASPYDFAPRPFARAVTQIKPVIIAMFIATVGAALARTHYSSVARTASLAIGVELNQAVADPRLALYLLAIATLTWTLASCAIASSAARRQIGLGIAFVVLGGYGFRWPNHYLLPLLGLALIVDAARRVREEELADAPFASETPAIPDASWSAYIGSIKAGLARSLDTVHTLTTRGDGGLSSSVIIGDARGLSVRTRIERIEGCVVALDIILGREVDEVRGSTFTVWAIAPRGLGVNPAGPPAAPVVKTGDAAFDDRFKTRGNRHAVERMLDDGLRARVVATLDGWLAYWDPESLRYRVYPGRGAPLDHPMPLSDLAQGRPVSADRLVAIVELLVEIAERGVKVEPTVEPSSLDDASTSS